MHETFKAALSNTLLDLSITSGTRQCHEHGMTDCISMSYQDTVLLLVIALLCDHDLFLNVRCYESSLDDLMASKILVTWKM